MGHSRSLEPEEIVEVDGIPVTSPARTRLDLAAVLSLEDLVVAGDYVVGEYNRGFGAPRRALVTLEALTAYMR